MAVRKRLPSSAKLLIGIRALDEVLRISVTEKGLQMHVGMIHATQLPAASALRRSVRLRHWELFILTEWSEGS